MITRIVLCSAAMLLMGSIAMAQAAPGSSMPQQQQPTPQQTPGAATTAPDTTTASMQQNMSDQAFLSKALHGGMAEVQLGQLAQEKSQSSDVKEFGQKMVQDHTQLGEQIK